MSDVPVTPLETGESAPAAHGSQESLKRPDSLAAHALAEYADQAVAQELTASEAVATKLPGPNWKSLIMPAALPITTDYLPLLLNTAEYFENHYAVMLSDQFSGGYENHRDLILEVRANRSPSHMKLLQICTRADGGPAHRR